MKTSKPSVWWIDERGRWNSFQDTYNARYNDDEMSSTSSFYGPNFSHLGLIKVVDHGRIIDIHWDVHNVETKALEALLEYLLLLTFSDKRQCYVALKFYFGAWTTEIYDTPENGLNRIYDIQDYRTSSVRRETQVFNQKISTLESSNNSFNRFFEYWDTFNGILTDNDSPFIENFMSESLLFEYDNYDNALIYKHIGQRSLRKELLGEEWRYQALGDYYRKDQSDAEFEDKVIVDYEPVMTSGEPKYDHIISHYKLPNDDPIWVNYERLLVPLHDEIGRPMIMCMTRQTQNLSVSFLDSIAH